MLDSLDARCPLALGQREPTGGKTNGGAALVQSDGSLGGEARSTDADQTSLDQLRFSRLFRPFAPLPPSAVRAFLAFVPSRPFPRGPLGF